MKPAPDDPVVVMEELAAAANEVAVLLKHFPVPGSAPASAVARVARRLNAAGEAHARVQQEILRRLLGRKS